MREKEENRGNCSRDELPLIADAGKSEVKIPRSHRWTPEKKGYSGQRNTQIAFRFIIANQLFTPTYLLSISYAARVKDHRTTARDRALVQHRWNLRIIEAKLRCNKSIVDVLIFPFLLSSPRPTRFVHSGLGPSCTPIRSDLRRKTRGPNSPFLFLSPRQFSLPPPVLRGVSAIVV